MSQFPHDQFAKDLLESLLSPFGRVETDRKISIDRLDPNSPYRQNALRLLLDLRVVLETRQNRNNQDMELLMSLRTSQPYLEYMAQMTREAERGLVLKQLNRKLGSLSPESIEKINNLNVEKLEGLGEALLDFTNVNDLNNWLD
jgi:hypothetical protein